ncbi:MAG TPA: hypothetical protein VLV76_25475 [Candidatus Acidoferrum sp.]|nr:hypothetical protein [Candidatus Acidoferrum sp.]
MRRPLDATNLNAADIEPAFALIQALHPALTLEHWRSFAVPLVSQEPLARSGLVGIRNEAGYLCGLFVYRVESDLAHERAFIVDVIAALDVVDVKFVIRAMMTVIQATARRLDCEVARVRVNRNQGGLALSLRESGLEAEAELLSMPLHRGAHG